MAIEHEAPEEVIQALKEVVLKSSTSLPAKYRALFALRNLKGPSAEAALLCALQDASALFRHEVAYCLGQRQDPAAVAMLRGILLDEHEHPMVRHEAGEALGAIGTPECFELLQKLCTNPCLEVAQTCQLALQRIQYYAEADSRSNGSSNLPASGANAGIQGCTPGLVQGASCGGGSPYLSVDPAPAAPLSTPTPDLRSLLLDEDAPIFKRYTALFALRNKGGRDEVAALKDCLRSESALLKHEVAYVLGQVQDPAAIDALEHVLRDALENAMVRHEAAEALGSIADGRCVRLLEDFSNDPEPIVAHSCIVALDMLAHEQSGEFQYAETQHTAQQTSISAC